MSDQKPAGELSPQEARDLVCEIVASALAICERNGIGPIRGTTLSVIAAFELLGISISLASEAGDVSALRHLEESLKLIPVSAERLSEKLDRAIVAATNDPPN